MLELILISTAVYCAVGFIISAANADVDFLKTAWVEALIWPLLIVGLIVTGIVKGLTRIYKVMPKKGMYYLNPFNWWWGLTVKFHPELKPYRVSKLLNKSRSSHGR